jgi:hypothetical protein
MRFLRSRFPSFPAAAAGLLLLSLAACDASPGPGSVRAYWHLGSQACAESGIDTVRVRVVTEGDDVVTPIPTTCDQGGQGLSIADVPAGLRQIVVEGLDDKGVARFEGQSEPVTIRSGRETVVPSIALGLRRAGVRVRWGFTNKLVCGANGVATIHLTAFDPPGNLVAGTDVHPCDVPLTTADPEGGAVLSGLPANTDLTLVVLGLSVLEQPTFGAAKDVRVGPGEVAELSILLDKCETGAACP